MRIYPAIRAQMGNWKYYIVRMKMREIANDVKFAHDIYEDKTLSDAIQRELGTKRVKKEIVGFLARRPDRFFSSIVVAATDSEPLWQAVEMDTEVVPRILSDTSALRESFGVLSFGDDPKYYALDGQHRVAAIKMLINGEAGMEAPPDFDNDMLSVIVVLREDHDVPEGEWRRRYRRLFSSLNRYAKPTNKDTNIIMDEDDLYAILTRRLITEHTFFQARGQQRERDSFKVLTKGKNLREGAQHFTTLQILYEMNTILLDTRQRQYHGWGPDGAKLDLQSRPEEDAIDGYYDELNGYWNAILKSFPDLDEDPRQMRSHTPEDDLQDHVLFWPIGQVLFARLVRAALDDALPEKTTPSEAEMQIALRRLAKVPWDLHSAPWKYILLTGPSDDSNKSAWAMRNEGRVQAVELMKRLVLWLIGIGTWDDDAVQSLRTTWDDTLYHRPEDDEIERLWAEIEDIKKRCSAA